MNTTIRPYAAYFCKPNVTLAGKGYGQGVRRRKQVYYERAKSPLQALFVRRVNEAMEVKGLSDNALARLIAPKDPDSVQRSVSRITGCTQDPTLEKVSQILAALDIPPEKLFSSEPVRERTSLVRGNSAEHNGSRTAKRNSAAGGRKAGSS